MSDHLFRFRHFELMQEHATHKMGTDAMLLGAYVQPGDAMNILDIGTGTGVLALMLAQRSTALVDAVEMDAGAAAEATANFDRSPWNYRLTCYHQPFQDFYLNETIHYDLIVSNPPYFEPINESKGANAQLPGKQRKDARTTTTLSFDELLQGVQQLLVSYGRFYVVLPEERSALFIETAAGKGLHLAEELLVRSFATSPPVRRILGFTKAPATVTRQELVIYAEKSEWTADYRQLTADFHARP